MRRKLIFLWCCCLISGIILLIFIGMKTNVVQTSAKPIYTNPEQLASQAEEVPGENAMRYTITLPKDTMLGRDYLGFYSVHQEVTVSCDNRTIYSFTLRSSVLGHTPGSAWHIIPIVSLPQESNLTITLYNAYDGANINKPVFFLGQEISFYTMLLKRHGLSYLICFITMLCGLVFLGYQLYMQRQFPENKTLLFLGAFTVLLSIWSGNESPLTLLLFQNNIVLSYLAYVSLMLMPVPLFLFTQCLTQRKDHPLWNVGYLVSILDFLICFCLQIFGVADFRQTLFLTQSAILICSGILIYLLLLEIKQQGLNKLLRTNFYCFLILMLFFCLDLLNYYRIDGADSSTFSRIGFLIYVLVMGCSLLANTRELIRKGQEENIYERLAYQDQLTGLMNRAAFQRDFAAQDATSHQPAMIMLDLNNLKQCNDSFGHAVGDEYIYQSAQTIDKAFRDLGSCYRIGGDEFCVLIPKQDDALFKAAQEKFNQELVHLKAAFPNIQADIAYGYAAFDPKIDQSFVDMQKRADRIMYENKRKEKSSAT